MRTHDHHDSGATAASGGLLPVAELAAIGLGANLGDREATLRAAIGRLASLPATSLRAASSFFENPAMTPDGAPPQPDYLNAAAILETRLPPRVLLDALLAVEREFGRVRQHDARWGPRTLDLDLLLFGSRVIHESGLSVPHPGVRAREFVLAPLAEIAPEMEIPGEIPGEASGSVSGDDPEAVRVVAALAALRRGDRPPL